MAQAVRYLLEKKVSRIVLARPAVEAGEKLGFLPGDIAEKVNPYLRPLYDALYDMMDTEKATRLIERGTIEVAPIAFMRGRTLNDAFVILDEAQNTTSEQMKMFLTRLGFGSKAVEIVTTGANRAPGLAAWLVSVAPARARGTMTVALVPDARIRALNRQYRKKDAPTDVLSFPSDARGYLGDVVIAVGVAKRQARGAGHSLPTELRVLALHGL